MCLHTHVSWPSPGTLKTPHTFFNVSLLTGKSTNLSSHTHMCKFLFQSQQHIENHTEKRGLCWILYTFITASSNNDVLAFCFSLIALSSVKSLAVSHSLTWVLYESFSCLWTVYKPVPILKYSLNADRNLHRFTKLGREENRLRVERQKWKVKKWSKEVKEEGSSKTRDVPRPFRLLYSDYHI